MAKIIELTKGYIAIVDDDDFETVSNHSWCADTSMENYVRAYCNIKKKIIKLHRFVLKLTDSKIIVDHINGNPLDNRKENLRICTRSQNQCNQKTWKSTKSSRYKGVSWRPDRSKWCAYISKNGKRKSLGCYHSEHEAAEAYNKKAIDLFGEFAKLNVIED